MCCSWDLIISKHGYLSIHRKTAARRRVKNNLGAPRVIAHCKQHGFIQKQDREETEHNKLYQINTRQSKNQSWNKGNQAKLDFLLCLVKYCAARDEPWERRAITQ